MPWSRALAHGLRKEQQIHKQRMNWVTNSFKLNAKQLWDEIRRIFFFFLSLSLSLFFFFFSAFLGHLQHKEVPRLEVTLELQLPAYTTATAMLDTLVHWARPGIKPIFSWIPVRFLTHQATIGTPNKSLSIWPRIQDTHDHFWIMCLKTENTLLKDKLRHIKIF